MADWSREGVLAKLCAALWTIALGPAAAVRFVEHAQREQDDPCLWWWAGAVAFAVGGALIVFVILSAVAYTLWYGFWNAPRLPVLMAPR